MAPLVTELWDRGGVAKMLSFERLGCRAFRDIGMYVWVKSELFVFDRGIAPRCHAPGLRQLRMIYINILACRREACIKNFSVTFGVCFLS